MDAAHIDAINYPTWSNPPRKIGVMDSPVGDNSLYLLPQTGLPAITVPIGFMYGLLPAGMSFIGRLLGEPSLIKFAHAYEQGTQHHRLSERFED